MEHNVCDRDKLLEEARAEVEAARHDRDWPLWVGVVHIMDKLIEHPQFTGVVSQIMHVMFFDGEESGHSG